MKDLLYLYLGVFFSIISVGLGSLVWHRFQLPYNVDGRYFDPSTGVAIEQQTLVVFAVLLVVAVLVAATFLRLGIKRLRCQESGIDKQK